MCISPILLPNVPFQECVSGSWSQASRYGGALATGTPRITAHPPCHSQGLLWQVRLFLPLHFWRFCVLWRICPCTFMYWVNPEQLHSWGQSLTNWGSLVVSQFLIFWTAWQVFESEILTRWAFLMGWLALVGLLPLENYSFHRVEVETHCA